MSAIEDRLTELGLKLPSVSKPVAAYVPAMVTGNLVFTAGQLPFVDGKLEATGKVGAEVSAEDAAQLARTCVLNALAAASSVIGSLDRVTRIVKVVGFVASAPDFTGQPAWSTAPPSCSARSSASPASTPAARSASRCCRSTRRSRSS